jgi:hypothetical protein
MAKVTSDTYGDQLSFPQAMSFHSFFERRHVHGPSEYTHLVRKVQSDFRPTLHKLPKQELHIYRRSVATFQDSLSSGANFAPTDSKGYICQ